jgi:hypothetical protein
VWELVSPTATFVLGAALAFTTLIIFIAFRRRLRLNEKD